MKQFERLLALRKAQERVREAEFARTRQAVVAAQRELQTAAQSRNAALVEAQGALSEGDRASWWLELNTGMLLERLQEELREVLAERSASADASRALMQRSRIESEQVRLLHERAVQHEREEFEKRQQSASDDRFAARAHWKSAARRSVRTHL